MSERRRGDRQLERDDENSDGAFSCFAPEGSRGAEGRMGHGTHAFFFFFLFLFLSISCFRIFCDDGFILTYLTGLSGTRNRSLSVSCESRHDRTTRARSGGTLDIQLTSSNQHSLADPRLPRLHSDMIQVSAWTESRDSFSGPHEGESNYTVVGGKTQTKRGRKSRRQPPRGPPPPLRRFLFLEPCGGRMRSILPSSGVYTTTIHQRAPEMPNPDVHNDDTSWPAPPHVDLTLLYPREKKKTEQTTHIFSIFLYFFWWPPTPRGLFRSLAHPFSHRLSRRSLSHPQEDGRRRRHSRAFTILYYAIVSQSGGR